MKTLTDEQYQLFVTVAAQLDYAYYHGDGDCLEAAYENARMALESIGEKTSEEEADDEEELTDNDIYGPEDGPYNEDDNE